MINYRFCSLIHVSIFFCSHGTLCAGTAAAVCNNTLCGCGIAYNAFIAGKNKVCCKILSTGPKVLWSFEYNLIFILYSYLGHNFTIKKPFHSITFLYRIFKIWIRIWVPGYMYCKCIAYVMFNLQIADRKNYINKKLY